MPAETTLCFGYKVDTQSLIDAADEWHNVKKSLRFLGMVVHYNTYPSLARLLIYRPPFFFSALSVGEPCTRWHFKLL